MWQHAPVVVQRILGCGGAGHGIVGGGTRHCFVARDIACVVLAVLRIADHVYPINVEVAERALEETE